MSGWRGEWWCDVACECGLCPVARGEHALDTACDDGGKVFKVAFDGGLGERRIHGSALHDITEPSSPPKKRKVTEVKQEVEGE